VVKTDDFRVDLPGGGGGISLQSTEEVDRWQVLALAYTDQYDLRKINDQTNLGTLLVQHVNLYRAQQALSGRVPELDDEDLPTGRYVSRVLKPVEIKAYQEQINTVSKEIREIEKTMGIDKKSRDAAGDESLKSWLLGMKARAHRYGLHVSKRVTAYEEFAMELRWRLRLNEVGDAEDKHYEDVDDAGVIKWAREQLAELEEADKKFAAEEGALVLGTAPVP
jgi:hypothetical protein